MKMKMKLKLELVMLVALSLLTTALVSAKCCGPKYNDNDWTHHEYTVLEIEITDVLTPSPDFYGTAPLQNGTSISCLVDSRGAFLLLRLLTIISLVVADAFSNLLYNENGTEVVGHNTGLCTLTPAVNNTGSLYDVCTIVHYFNNEADQVVLVGGLNFDAAVSPMAVVGGIGAYKGASGSCITTESGNQFLYECDFWTPNYQN